MLLVQYTGSVLSVCRFYCCINGKWMFESMACNNNITWYTTVERTWYRRKGKNWHALEELQPTIAEIRCKTFLMMNCKCCFAKWYILLTHSCQPLSFRSARLAKTLWWHGSNLFQVRRYDWLLFSAIFSPYSSSKTLLTHSKTLLLCFCLFVCHHCLLDYIFFLISNMFLAIFHSIAMLDCQLL